LISTSGTLSGGASTSVPVPDPQRQGMIDVHVFWVLALQLQETHRAGLRSPAALPSAGRSVKPTLDSGLCWGLCPPSHCLLHEVLSSRAQMTWISGPPASLPFHSGCGPDCMFQDLRGPRAQLRILHGLLPGMWATLLSHRLSTGCSRVTSLTCWRIPLPFCHPT
jgi:hypothetical protein